jgi:hypothetical protein
MWIPGTADQIEAAARDGGLTETSSFDAKAMLPQPGRNGELAKDIAAMTTDGGVLLYGIAEDDEGRPSVLCPISLDGARERIDQVAQTALAEAPFIEVREYPTDADPSNGYIAVVIPQSARAPHQVTASGRFYGRGATGNRRLTEGEISRLYRRREEWDQDRDRLLNECVTHAHFRDPGDEYGFLHGFVRPVAPDRAIWDRALVAAGDRSALQQALFAAASARRTEDFGPSLRRGAQWHRMGADAWQLSTLSQPAPSQNDADELIAVMLNIDGRGSLFAGRAVERIGSQGHNPNGSLVIFEHLIAGTLAGFFACMGKLFSLADYHGHVDLGLVVTGIEGGVTAQARVMGDGPRYNAATYPRTDRVAAAELDDPRPLVRRLLRHLFEATTGRDNFEPFD